jgi:hypothetical protein
MRKYRRLEDKPKLLWVTIIKGIKKILKFITSEEFNQQAMIFKLGKEMRTKKKKRNSK